MAKAPWWGGFFERMIKSAKRCLKKLLRYARLTYEEMLTVLVDIEAVINSRPLTYLYDDDVGVESLTPSHLMIGRRILSAPSNCPVDDVDGAEDDTPTPKTLSKRVQYLQRLNNQFWLKWSREYLTELREQHRPKKTRFRMGPTIHRGDVVCVYSDKVRRNLWHLGKVEDLVKAQKAVKKVFTQKNSILI